MINILYFHNHSNISGGEQSLLNLWSNLNRTKFRPFLIIPQKGELERRAIQIGVQVNYRSVCKFRLKNSVKILKTILFLIKYCCNNNIKIIHSYSPRNNILSAIIGKFLKIPVIWHERNLIYGSEKDISKIFQFLPDCIICNSAAVAQRFQRKSGLPLKIKIIKNGVDTANFRPQFMDRACPQGFQLKAERIVGLVSNLNKRKMPEYFIAACPHILKEYPDTKFLIVGGEFSKNDNGRIDELKSNAKALGIDGNIFFTGFRNDVANIIQSFDVGVAVTEKEACSRAILEMMACGKPVVAFDTGGNSELIEDSFSGKLVKFGDIRGLARNICDLLKNDEKRKVMGEYARNLVRTKFDIKNSTRITETLYTELAKPV